VVSCFKHIPYLEDKFGKVNEKRDESESSDECKYINSSFGYDESFNCCKYFDCSNGHIVSL